jgi:hypothetical protein
LEKTRGVVVSPGFRSLGPTGFAVDTADIQGLMRQCLLYWDVIDWPTNNLIHLGVGPDEEFLVSAGVLRRTRIQYNGIFGGDLSPLFAQGQLKVFAELNRREPGSWSIAQSSDKLAFPGQQISESRSLEMQLNTALPVPADTVAFQDVLEFRQYYRAELLALRSVMDEICKEIEDPSDIEAKRKLAVGRLKSSLDDIDKALAGRNVAHFPVSVSIDIKLRDIIQGAMSGVNLAKEFNMPIPLGGVLGAVGSVASSLKFQIVNVRTPDSVRNGPFAYLYHVKKELDK